MHRRDLQARDCVIPLSDVSGEVGQFCSDRRSNVIVFEALGTYTRLEEYSIVDFIQDGYFSHTVFGINRQPYI